MSDLINILRENDIKISEDDISKISSLANESGELDRSYFVDLMHGSNFLKLDCKSRYIPNWLFGKHYCRNLAFGKDKHDITKDLFLTTAENFTTLQVEVVLQHFDKSKHGKLSMEQVRKILIAHAPEPLETEVEPYPCEGGRRRKLGPNNLLDNLDYPNFLSFYL